jgi:hypothetical protein
MSRRVAVAAGGGLVTSSALGAALALSPVRPSGLPVGLAVIGVLVPWIAWLGTRSALLAAREPEADQAGRLAAVGAPVLVVLVVFVVNLVAGVDDLGPQQVAALVLGTVGASALAARFSDPALAEEG